LRGGGEFRKPAGFEGVKKQSRQKRGEGGMMGDEHQWGKKGSVREWDQDKEAELGSEEEDQRVLDGLDSDSESVSDDEEGSDSDDEAAIREMLMSAKALDRKREGAGSGASKQKKETIEREMRRDEEGMMGERQGSGPKGGKKQGRGGGGAGGAKRGKARR